MRFIPLLLAFCCVFDCYAMDANLERQCNKGNGEACFTLGFDTAADASGIFTTKSIKYFERACQLKYVGGCNVMGELYWTGNGVSQSYAKAKKYYERSCGLNNGYGCVWLGRLYFTGKGVPASRSQAKKYEEKACRLNNGEGCGLLGAIYELEGSLSTARMYFAKGCNLGNEQSCSFLDTH